MIPFKLHDIVIVKYFPYESDIFKIVATKIVPWKKASPFTDPNLEIKVEEGKDFILLRKNGKNFGIEGLPENGLHVNEHEIEMKQNKTATNMGIATSVA